MCAILEIVIIILCASGRVIALEGFSEPTLVDICDNKDFDLESISNISVRN